VIQVDVRHDDRCKFARPDAERGKRVTDSRSRRCGASLDQARPVAADQVAGRDPVVASHPRVDLVHLVPEIGDDI